MSFLVKTSYHRFDTYSMFEVEQFVKLFGLMIILGERLNPFMANKLMTAALRLEMPEVAVDIFEDSFGFCFDTDPAKGKNHYNKNTELKIY